MKGYKPFLGVIICLLCLCFAAAAGAANTAADPAAELGLTVQPFADKSTEIVPVAGRGVSGYFLFLPAGADRTRLRVSFSGECAVNGKPLHSSSTTDAFQADGAYTLTFNGEEKLLTVMQSENIPAVFIQTESGSLEKIHADKNHKEAAVITTAENGKLTLQNAPLKHIKGRGNATWDAKGDKKPYNIKFETAVDLLGMGKAKKWSLLANHLEDSLLRNAVALSLAQDMESASALDFRFADLYINGNYRGNYLICESVTVSENRVNITDLEAANEAANPGLRLSALKQKLEENASPDLPRMLKYTDIPKDPADISGGYLLELEHFSARFEDEIAGFSSLKGNSVTVKHPEYLSKAEIEYIANSFSQMEAAIYSETGRNADGKHYTELLDQDSFVNMVLLQELTFNADFVNSSNFIYKDAGSDLFFAGPAWDFDLSITVPSEEGKRDRMDYWFLYSNDPTDSVQYLHETIFSKIFQHKDFFDAAARRWFALSPSFAEAAETRVQRYADRIAASAVMNGFRWDRLSGKTAAEKEADFRSLAAGLTKTLQKRISVLDRGFADPSSVPSASRLVVDHKLEVDPATAPTWPEEETTAPAAAPNNARSVTVTVVILLLLLLAALGIVLRRKHRAGMKKEVSADES